jgi:hypothetical protein
MRRPHAWIAGAAGGLAAWRLLRRRRRVAPEPAVEPGPDPRAEELRAKLAERGGEEEPEAPPEPAAAVEDPDERRRRVHEAGRAALDEMHDAE